jgi:hypothetical protein
MSQSVSGQEGSNGRRAGGLTGEERTELRLRRLAQQEALLEDARLTLLAAEAAYLALRREIEEE